MISGCAQCGRPGRPGWASWAPCLAGLLGHARLIRLCAGSAGRLANQACWLVWFGKLSWLAGFVGQAGRLGLLGWPSPATCEFCGRGVVRPFLIGRGDKFFARGVGRNNLSPRRFFLLIRGDKCFCDRGASKQLIPSTGLFRFPKRVLLDQTPQIRAAAPPDSWGQPGRQAQLAH